MKFRKIAGLTMAAVMTAGAASVSFAEAVQEENAQEEDRFCGIRDLNDDSNYILYNPKTKELRLGTGYKYEKDTGRIYGRGEEYVLDSETGNILPAGEERDETRYSADNIRTYNVKGGKIYYNTSGSITASDKNITSCFIPRVMPDGIKIRMIKSEAFAYCQGLKEVNIPSSIGNIESRAFDGCTGLKNVNIPSGVINISSGAFRSCTALENITIPKTVASIGSYAFSSCGRLTNITISSNIDYISDKAFDGCKALKNVVVSNGVKRVEANFLGKLNNLKDSGKIESITIPKTVEFIDPSVFKSSERETPLTIRCFKNSYADKFASENNIPCVYIDDSSILVPYVEEDNKMTSAETSTETTSEVTSNAE